MVVGARVEQRRGRLSRRPPRSATACSTGSSRSLFGQGFTDILSGYRVLSRRFAKSFPAASSGFEIETELSVHALDLKLACRRDADRPTARGPRIPSSKLRTYRDGAAHPAPHRAACIAHAEAAALLRRRCAGLMALIALRARPAGCSSPTCRPGWLAAPADGGRRWRSAQLADAGGRVRADPRSDRRQPARAQAPALSRTACLPHALSALHF